jgi:hypothetical protein
MTKNSLRFKYADPQDPWEIIDTPWGRMEAWRASTMATGTMGSLQSVYEIVKNDSASVQDRIAALDAHKAMVSKLCSMIDSAHSRMDSIAAKQEALEIKHREDAVRGARAAG